MKVEHNISVPIGSPDPTEIFGQVRGPGEH